MTSVGLAKGLQMASSGIQSLREVLNTDGKAGPGAMPDPIQNAWYHIDRVPEAVVSFRAISMRKS